MSNIAERILQKFANKKWLQFEDLCFAGKITLDEAIVSEFSLIKASKEVVLEEVEKNYHIRSNFTNFVEYCSSNDIPFIILSSGLDFVINHILEKIGVVNKIKLVSVTTINNSDNTFTVKGPERFDESKKDFKSDHVSHYKELGYRVIYIGDSYSDFYAVLEDIDVFSIRGSKLSDFCTERKISFTEFEDFHELVEILKK